MKLSTGSVEAVASDYCKHPAIGECSAGIKFDSGCNVSRLTKIDVVCGKSDRNYLFVVKRIFFYFADQNSFDEKMFPYYNKYSDKDIRYSVDINPDDTIRKVAVWENSGMTSAVQFHFTSGCISPMYGCPNGNAKEHEFRGSEGSQLVGLHGSYSGDIRSLGFSFASVVNGVPKAIDTISSGFSFAFADNQVPHAIETTGSEGSIDEEMI